MRHIFTKTNTDKVSQTQHAFAIFLGPNGHIATLMRPLFTSVASRGSEEGKVESELKKGAMFKAFGILEIHCLSHDMHVEPQHFSTALSCAMAAPAVTELNGILATVPITGEYNLQVHMAGFRLDFIGFSHEVKGFFPTLSQTGSAFSVTGNASLGVILLETCWLICSLPGLDFPHKS